MYGCYYMCQRMLVTGGVRDLFPGALPLNKQSQLCAYIYIYTHAYMCMYIYIYICVERERDR